jgi:undecaprenyl-diphosphatase
VEEIIAFDHKLFLSLNGMGSIPFDAFWMFMTNKAVNVSVYLVVLTYFLKKTNLKSFLILLVIVGLLVLVTDQVTNLFKYGFQRLRPCHEPLLEGLVRLVKPNCGGSYGYFSGHASNSFALAVFFSLILKSRAKIIPLILLVLASLIAYSRIYIGVHYPLDVLSGVVFGSLSGFIFYLVWKPISPPIIY